MKINYLNEGVFGSYKDKTTKENKVKGLKNETLKVLIKDVVKKLPVALKERIGQEDYLNSILSRKSVESYNYNFSQMFLRLHDFLGVDVEGDTIYLQFTSKFIASEGYTSTGPTGYEIDVYSLDHYNTYLMAEALCLDLFEEFGPGINFDFKFVLPENLNGVGCNIIHICNRNKINHWSLETLQKCIKYPEFLIKHSDVYENRTADEVYLKLLEKTYTADNTKFNSIIGYPEISIENISDDLKFENKTSQYIVSLCKNFPKKIRFYFNPNKELDTAIECCEAITGKSLKDILNNKSTICMLSLSPNTVSDHVFTKIVQELDDISLGHFYVSTKLKSANRRILTPCESAEQAMNILIEKTYGEKISLVELGLFVGNIVTHDETFNNMVERVKRMGDNKFYYLHVAINDM